jgi:hypothetical protein
VRACIFQTRGRARARMVAPAHVIWCGVVACLASSARSAPVTGPVEDAVTSLPGYGTPPAPQWSGFLSAAPAAKDVSTYVHERNRLTSARAHHDRFRSCQTTCSATPMWPQQWPSCHGQCNAHIHPLQKPRPHPRQSHANRERMRVQYFPALLSGIYNERLL